MGLLDKTNPKATPRSVLLWAMAWAGIGAFLFFLAFKPAYREAWRIALPIWVLLCAGVGALVEWQVADEGDENDESH
jgi:hypothetical protein